MAQLLIAEDDELLRDALQTQLTQAGHAVAVAEDGQVALDMMTRSAYDALVLDLGLPKVDGLEVLERVKRNERLRHIPIVMLTSSREEQDLVKSYELGVNAFVVKPVEFNEFFKAIQDLGVFWALLNEPPPGSLRNGRA